MSNAGKLGYVFEFKHDHLNEWGAEREATSKLNTLLFTHEIFQTRDTIHNFKIGVDKIVFADAAVTEFDR